MRRWPCQGWPQELPRLELAWISADDLEQRDGRGSSLAWSRGRQPGDAGGGAVVGRRPAGRIRWMGGELWRWASAMDLLRSARLDCRLWREAGGSSAGFRRCEGSGTAGAPLASGRRFQFEFQFPARISNEFQFEGSFGKNSIALEGWKDATSFSGQRKYTLARTVYL